MRQLVPTTSRRWLRRLAAAVTVAATVCSSIYAAAAQPVSFTRDIRPILEKCITCHGGVKQTAGLSLLDRSAMLTPPDSEVVAVVPGDAEASELYHRVRSDDEDVRMPPEEPLLEHEIVLLRRWIDAGAEWPTHWAYQTVNRPDLSDVREHPIDHLVVRRLGAAGLWPSPPADRRTLIRRLSLDLTGLLPTPAEVEAFVRDRSPTAEESLVDRLLASPHFGERWGRHWLDEARYADSEGYEKDTPKADAFRYRDWVIDAMNSDLPFDHFTLKQLAGDLLPDSAASDLIATKFHLQAQFNLEGGVDNEEDRTKRVIDRINTVATVWLGTTLGCCQCHNHPYDPLEQQDFYAFYAFFNNYDLAADFLAGEPEDAEKLRAERAQKWSELEELLQKQVVDKNLSSRGQSLLSGLRNFDNEKGFTRYLRERDDARLRATYVFSRGDFLRPQVEGGEIRPDTPAVLPQIPPRGPTPDRLDLARWLTAAENPLTARVFVNRVWMHLFGAPLVEPTIDFGSRGEPPSHPELLDWLAHWVVHEGRWSRKELVRLIVSSKTYKQASQFRDELQEIDPRNRLLARQNRFRLEAEILRDVALDAAGLLARKVGGPSVYPPVPEIVTAQTYGSPTSRKVSEGEDRYRRGMYTFFRRTAIDPNLTTFDCPDSGASTPRRERSNNALQALTLLHNEVFHEAAQAFAGRLLAMSPGFDVDDAQRIDGGLRIALGRPGTAAELQVLERLLDEARDYYQDQPEAAAQFIGDHGVRGVDPGENAAWVAVARNILNLDEFITRE